MEIERYIEEMREIQKQVLDYLDSTENGEEDFSKLTSYFDDIKIIENSLKFKEFIQMIANISYKHHYTSLFYNKIEKICFYFKESILHHFSDFELIIFFIYSPRMIFFFIEQKFVIFNEKLASYIQLF